MNALFLFVTLGLLICCSGYRLGPPLSACSDMYPTGHHNTSQRTPSPFSFTLNATKYRPGDVIKVFLNSSGEWFMEGVLIQVRALDCNNLNSPAVGKFSTEIDDEFLQTFNCFGETASALRHYSHYHIYNRTFYWTAPSAPVGDVRLRATIARNQATFWTNVLSETIEDASGEVTTCGAMELVVSVGTLVLASLVATLHN